MSIVIEQEIDGQEQKRRVERHFAQSESWRGRLYEDDSHQFNRAMMRRKQYAFEMLKKQWVRRGSKAIDLGCAGGAYVEELMAMGFDTYGIDLSREMLDVCRAKLNLDEKTFRSHFRQGDVEQISFDDGEFDLVLCVGVLGYLLDDRQALKEIVRVLKPGGYFLVSVQNMMSLSNVDYVLRQRLLSVVKKTGRVAAWDAPGGMSMHCPWILQNARVPHCYRLYDPWKLEQKIRSLGFQQVDSRSSGYEFRILRRLRLIPERLLGYAELQLEQLSQRFRGSYLAYSGDTYTVLFRKI